MSTSPVALVAGASRGLGLLIARNLAGRGYAVAILARDQESLQRACDAAARDGLTLRPYVADVSDNDAVQRTVDEIETNLGPIEVSIHVAGVIQVGPLESVTREHFEQAINIMAWGPINVALAVLPQMRSRGRGRIGTVASVGGAVSVPHLLPYSTAKFASVGFAEGLSAELAGTGITSTAILPGLMRTGSHLQARFLGDTAKEYAWFAPGAALPGVAMNPERAADKIVSGVLAGRPVLALSPLTKVALRVKGLAPATTVRGLGLMSRLLPAAGSTGTDGETVPGTQARSDLRRRYPRVAEAVDRMTVLGDRAALRTNETGGHAS